MSREFPNRFNVPFFVIRAQSDDERNAALRSMTDADAAMAKLQMMRKILTDRFHLRYHTETRVAPSFLLLAGKQHKITMSAAKALIPGDERGFDLNDLTQPAMSERCMSHGCDLIARGQAMEWLCEIIGGQLPGPVADRTNLSGLWDFKLQWSSSNVASQDQEEYPPIETALADQLG